MNRKIIMTLLCSIFLATACEAAVQMKVTAINEFDTEKPAQTMDVTVRENVVLGNYELKEGDILKSNVVEVTDPKRGKRDAVFCVQPYAYVSDGCTKTIDEKMYGKYSKRVLSKEELKKMPKGKIVQKAAVTVGSFYVKGLSQGVSLVKGVVQNQDGNRVKSGVKQVYEDSPLSYVEKGHELDIKPDEQFYFVFNLDDEAEEKPNYSYTEPAQ